MTATVFSIVLFAALVHAGWNVAVKRAGDPRTDTVAVFLGAGLVAAIVLPIIGLPAPASLPWLLAAVVLQIGYVLLLAGAYGVADIGVAYPLMRGAAPMIVAGVSAGVFGEALSATAWIGIAGVSLGILSLAFAARRSGAGRGAALALVNACFIAGYTLVDGYGVRLSGSAAAYTLSESLLTAVPFLVWVLAVDRGGMLARLRGRLGVMVGGGVATTTSYGLALWAMTLAPVATVAALRETSIVFALVLARFVLGERPGRARIGAAVLVALGAAVLRLA
jgi:drug/metabolite transporter (DMT)-like permease